MQHNIKTNYEISIVSINKLRIIVNPVIQIFHMLKGRASLLIDQNRIQLEEDDIAVLPPGRNYHLESDVNNVILAVQLNSDIPATGFVRNMAPAIFSPNERSSHNYDQIREVLVEIACANFRKENDDEQELYSLIYKFLGFIAKSGKRRSEWSIDTDENSVTAQRLNSIKTYICENFRLPITLNDLAREQFLTPQYLSRIFKKIFGMNFFEYLNNVRLNSAVLDLINKNEPVIRICFDNGFPNVAAFNKVFKQKYAVSPQVYRKQVAQRQLDVFNEPESDFKTIDFKSVENQLNMYLNNTHHDIGQPQKEKVLLIEADITQFSPMKLMWEKIINLGFASDIGKSNLKSQIELFQSKMSFKYARFQGIFNEDPAIMPSNQTKYNFYNCDSLIDYLYSINLLPFIEIGNKPKKINYRPMKNLFNEEKNYTYLNHQQLETVFKEFLKHCVNRYGVSEVEKWRFEFWAEHDEYLRYDDNYIPDYITTYSNISQIIKSIMPNAQFGGPGFNMAADISVFGRIITGLSTLGITPDFISFYSYPYTIMRSKEVKETRGEGEFSVFWDRYDYSRNLKNAKKYVKLKNPDVKNFYITEWNVDYSNRNYLHDSCFKAAFILQTIIDSNDVISGLGYWLLSDISSEYIDSAGLLYGGAGLINRNGIRKPGYFAYEYLSKLGSHLIKKGENHIITRHSDNEFEVLVFNYKYLSHYSLINYDYEKDFRHINNLLEDQDDLSVTIQLRNVREGKYSVKQYALNSEHGSLLDEWIRLSAPDNIQQSEVDYLRNICVPKRQIYKTHSTETGDLILNCNLMPNEIDLFLIRLELD